MNYVYFCVRLSFLLIVLLKAVSLFLSEKSFLNREELRSYECGFEHHSLSRIPFSLRYFLLTLVFLLFDLEIVLIIFIPYRFYSYSFFFFTIILLIFLLVLFFSLLFEWLDGRLE